MSQSVHLDPTELKYSLPEFAILVGMVDVERSWSTDAKMKKKMKGKSVKFKLAYLGKLVKVYYKLD